MFSLYSDLPAPKNSASTLSTPSTPAPTPNATPTATPATPVADAKVSPSTPQTSTPTTGWGTKFGMSNDKGGGVALSNAFAQSVMLKKKRLQQQQQKTHTPSRASTTTSAVHDPEKEPVTPSSQSQQSTLRSSSESVGSEEVPEGPSFPRAVSIFAKEGEIIHDMYDPVVPNDYEDYVIERQVMQERRRRDEEEQRMEEQRRKKMQQQSSFGFSYQAPKQAARPEDDLQNEWAKFEAEAHVQPPPRARSPVPAPPPANVDLNISGEEAWKRRAALTAQMQGGGLPPPREPSPPPSSNNGFSDSSLGGGGGGGGGRGGGGRNTATNAQKAAAGLSVAERMMKRMGWKEGEGLGAQGQGIKNPLAAKKTGRGLSTGVIVGGEKTAEAGPPAKRPKTEYVSRVVLLRNMVGPGEVDEELEGETASECEKYGKVLKCSIHEEKGPGVPASKAVRIFIQFETLEASARAFASLNGRFFAKRMVEASYFDEERFLFGDLAAWPGEQ